MGRYADPDKPSTRELLVEIERLDDPRQAWGTVKRRIDDLQRLGREVPEALIIAERQLMTELTAESQGR